ELVISGDYAGPRPPAFDPAVLDQAAEIPGVAAAAGLYSDLAAIDGDAAFVGATDDFAAARENLRYTVDEGRKDRLRPGEMVVDDRTAEDRGLSVGDRVEVQLSRGEPESYQVVGLYEWSPVSSGFVLPAEAIPDFGIPQPSMGLVKLDDGTPAGPVRDQLSALLAD